MSLMKIGFLTPDGLYVTNVHCDLSERRRKSAIKSILSNLSGLGFTSVQISDMDPGYYLSFSFKEGPYTFSIDLRREGESFLTVSSEGDNITFSDDPYLNDENDLVWPTYHVIADLELAKYTHFILSLLDVGRMRYWGR